MPIVGFDQNVNVHIHVRVSLDDNRIGIWKVVGTGMVIPTQVPR